MENQKEYIVYITETLQRKVKVKADNLTDAEEKVQEMYSKEEITIEYKNKKKKKYDKKNNKKK